MRKLDLPWPQGEQGSPTTKKECFDSSGWVRAGTNSGLAATSCLILAKTILSNLGELRKVSNTE